MQKLLAGLAKILMVAVLVGTAWIASDGFARAQFFAATCAADDEIAAEQRTAIEIGALGFVRNFVNSNTSEAYELLTPAARETISLDQFTDLAQRVVAPMGPFNDLRVAHAYLVKAVGGSAGTRMICGSLGRAEDWSAVATKPMSAQAHVLVEAQTRNNGFTFALWLVPEREWKIQYFHMTASSMVGKTAQDILLLARREREVKHLFNATVLYASANQLAFRGPNFQLGIDPEIKKEMSALQVPRELQGNPPFAWKLADHDFKILNVGPIGVGQKLYLMITQETAQLGPDQEAEQKNQVLISDFIRAVPEYANVFAGLVIAATEAGGHRGFRTVYENDSSAR
jgi:hypothetical protein